ncbi:hypothetical protein KTR60_10295 [Rhodococcus sp. C1]|uniref:hypothetical protein n=1 Tax=Rhodococcus sp. C1 TaxID=644410 RepID=UPI001E46A745|nr:hypothetical protein [Rhodococcus sp. C1]UEL35083.1 hypothetical protein KTR60_10295 [Rhodococcus sp. C1]
MRDVESASALLLLHHITGEPLAESDPIDTVLAIDAHAIGSVLDPATAFDALGDVALREAVDELAEAAYSGGSALQHVVDSLIAPSGPWAGEALTQTGEDLLTRAIIEVQRVEPREIAPAGPGGLLLTTALATRAEEHERWTIRRRASSPEHLCNQVAWRSLAAQEFPIEPYTEVRSNTADTIGVLHIMQWLSVSGDSEFFDHVEDLLMDLSELDLLLVVGPANLMTDRHGASRRRRLLVPSESYTAPLRYVARLPKGLSRFGGRRRLALWVFGRPSSTWTVVGSHSDTNTDFAAREAIAADTATAVSNSIDLYAHAFRTSTVLKSDVFLRQSTLTAPPATSVRVDGGERLARVWELNRGLLDGMDLSVAESQPGNITFARASRGFGRDLAGARIPAEHLAVPQTGWVKVIGPEEVRDPMSLGRRGIDRLTLEEVAPRSTLTEPGDVVYVTVGGCAALVDYHGGHAVATPARIFRCKDDASHDRRLVPAVVAANIASQPGSDRSTWQLQTVPVDAVPAITEIAHRVENRKRFLLNEIRDLEALDTELIEGLSTGSLTATVRTSHTTKAE